MVSKAVLASPCILIVSIVKYIFPRPTSYGKRKPHTMGISVIVTIIFCCLKNENNLIILLTIACTHLLHNPYEDSEKESIYSNFKSC